jgi:hypothetical protein
MATIINSNRKDRIANSDGMEISIWLNWGFHATENDSPISIDVFEGVLQVASNSGNHQDSQHKHDLAAAIEILRHDRLPERTPNECIRR